MPAIRSYIDWYSDSPDSNHPGGREVVVFSTRSPQKTTRNEDSVAWIAWSEALLIVLADGVGGQPGGGETSELAVSLVVDRFKNINDDEISQDLFREGVLDAYEEANRVIWDLGTGSGTTLTVVTIIRDTVRVFNVGDSSTLVCGGKGKLKFTNTPHSPTGYAVAAGVLDADEALHHKERHLISNIVGSPEMHIDIGPVLRLAKRDRILVASDGLWDNMYMNEIIDAIKLVPSSRAARLLIQTCSNRMSNDGGNLPGHADDLSFVVVRSVARKVKAHVGQEKAGSGV